MVDCQLCFVWIVCMLIVPLPVSSIDCEKLTNDDMRNVKSIVLECGESPSLGRHPDASAKPLDISSLSDKEFAKLFSKKKTLKIALRAWNSNIENMNFSSLTSFQDDVFQANKSLLELANNRNLKSVSLPLFHEGQFNRTKNRTLAPFFFIGNPLVTMKNIDQLKCLTGCSLYWEMENRPGTCHLTHVVENLSDLNNCERVDGNLVIDEAVGETTTKLREINGNISITNSNISDISFLAGSRSKWLENGNMPVDVYSSNPNLCLTENLLVDLEMRDLDGFLKIVNINNKDNRLCERPSTTCVGGNLHDHVVRSRIEERNCEDIVGDVIIDHLINKESDITDKLRAGLSRIRKVFNGSVVVTSNEALKKMDFFKDLEEVHSRSCQAPAIEISSNFKLENVTLRDGIILSNGLYASTCLKLSIGGNGVEGRGRVLTDYQMEHYWKRFREEMSVWIHPREGRVIEHEKDLKLFRSIGIFVAVTTVSLIGIAFYVYKMVKRSNSHNRANSERI